MGLCQQGHGHGELRDSQPGSSLPLLCCTFLLMYYTKPLSTIPRGHQTPAKKMTRYVQVHSARTTSIDHGMFIGSKVFLELTELPRRRRRRLNIDSLCCRLPSRPGCSISSYPIRDHDGEFGSACTDIRSEPSQAGHTGPEAQRQLTSSSNGGAGFSPTVLLSWPFQVLFFTRPVVNSKRSAQQS